MSRRLHSSSGVGGFRTTTPHSTADLELVTDDVLQVVIYIDLRDSRVADAPGVMAVVVDMVGSWLDYYKYLGFRQFDLKFQAFRAMFEAQKDRDRKRQPR